MYFIIDLLILADWKSNSYNLILVIVNQLIKMVNYKPVKVIINCLGLIKVTLDMVV